MPLAPGSHVGPYEVVALLGSGGMGEVYVGRDPRIGREVAIKVLPSSYAKDAERLQRFEQEARSAGALNHPNILIIHDFGTQEGSPYLVSEYLEGETLRQRLRGPLSQRRAAEYARQIASGLAAAHEKGIVHRDLKPENIFLTKDERIKILDFGLAKLIEPQAPENRSLIPTSPPETEAGMVLGTVGYMSPEQVRGLPANHRSDIFAFGAILYEMVTGNRAFRGDSPADTISAILKEDPPEARDSNPNLSPALERILRHCLEKNPEARFQSARDLAFDLEMISESSGTSKISKVDASAKGKRNLTLLAAALAFIALLAIAFFAGQKFAGENSKVMPSPPIYHRLTFSRGDIQSARFASDGHSLVYSASLQGARIPQLYDVRTEGVVSRQLGIQDARVLSISSTGQMAIRMQKGILAQAPLSGGAPRALMENVIFADWSPDGTNLAIVREISRKRRLEYPIGKVLYETSEYIHYVRFSPKGNLIAFTLHPSESGDTGKVAIIDLSGKQKAVSEQWYPHGLAWRPDGNEIWFSTWSREQAGGSVLCGLSIEGKKRVIQRFPGYAELKDISLYGTVLMTFKELRSAIHALLPGDAKEHDLSWLDVSEVKDVSADGKILLFNENGEGAEEMGVVTYLRRTADSEAVRLGPGGAISLSADSKYALVSANVSNSILVLPTGPGEPKKILNDKLPVLWAEWLPGEKEILVSRQEEKHSPRLYLLKMSGGEPAPISPVGFYVPDGSGHMISPDGKFVIVVGKDGKKQLWPLHGSEPLPLPGIAPDEVPFQWSANSQSVYTYLPGQLPAQVFAVDIATGQRRLVRELMPDDSTGVTSIGDIRFLPDEKHYAYDYNLNLATLYLITGLN